VTPYKVELMTTMMWFAEYLTSYHTS